MKYSGIEWIGDMPDTWELVKIGSLFLCRNEKVSDTDYPPLSVSRGGVVPQMENVAKSDANDNRKLVLAGDFAINSRSDRKQSCGLSELDGSVSLINTVLYLRSKDEVYGKYLNFLLKNYGFAEEFYRWGHGIVADLWTTRWQEMKNIVLPLPTKERQIALTKEIEKKLEEIDRLTEIETQQIEKLKEYKQAVITEAVTKGLDKNAPMKDSGVEWIGKVPVGWSLPSIKMIADTCSGGTPQSGNLEYYDGDINWVCSYDLKESVIEESKIKITKKGASIIAGKMQKPGSVLIAMYGGGGTIGNSGRLNCYARTNQAICSIDFNRDLVLPEYAHYVVKFMRSFWMIYAVGTRKDPNINQVIVDNMPFICPTIDEQRKIIDYLDEKCASIEKLLIIKQQKIEKLNEYKKSLIYEYVTGKKEVI